METALVDSNAVASPAEHARRENLELIKLRHEVRQLKQDLVDAHASVRPTSLRTVVRGLLPGAVANEPFKFRPEWKGKESYATNWYAREMQALAQTTNEYARFHALGRAARMSFAVGRIEDARRFATDLTLNEKYSRGDPEKLDGDAVHDGNLVLGRIALEEGRVEEAKRHLLAAGKTRGSAVLGSFGPSMSLANDLLQKGEQETVLQYFKLCRVFWGFHSEKLDTWTQEIHAGRIPDFGSSHWY